VREKIILGTVQLGLPFGINNQDGQPSKEHAFQILDTAADNLSLVRSGVDGSLFNQAQVNPDHPFLLNPSNWKS
jgi:hypothetical protein